MAAPVNSIEGQVIVENNGKENLTNTMNYF